VPKAHPTQNEAVLCDGSPERCQNRAIVLLIASRRFGKFSRIWAYNGRRLRSLISAILIFVLTAVVAPAGDFVISKQHPAGVHRAQVTRTTQSPVLPEFNVPAQVVAVAPAYLVGAIVIAIEPSGFLPVFSANKPSRAPPQFSRFA
jgi:hypothetical protein